MEILAGSSLFKCLIAIKCSESQWRHSRFFILFKEKNSWKIKEMKNVGSILNTLSTLKVALKILYIMHSHDVITMKIVYVALKYFLENITNKLWLEYFVFLKASIGRTLITD